MVRAKSLLEMHYVNQFSEDIQPFIVQTKDVQADGNCGYRVIASMLGYGEAGWAQVRRGLLQEINTFDALYEGVFGCSERFLEIKQSLVHFEGAAPFNKWMTLPDMGYLIASYYNIVLFTISKNHSFTILPLRTPPFSNVSRRTFAIGFVNDNHFIEVFIRCCN